MKIKSSENVFYIPYNNKLFVRPNYLQFVKENVNVN